MSKYFLDVPREKLSDQSVSLKSSLYFPSEPKLSQGLLMLSNVFSSQSKKKSSFIAWKYYCDRSFYSLWKETLDSSCNAQEFEVILKILHKRKSEVDDLWGNIKAQEEKFESLQKKNKILEAKNLSIQGKIPEFNEKSVQVSFLQDSMLRRTQIELEQLEKTLGLKEKELELLENHLAEKSDNLNVREKNLHQKEVNLLMFNEIESEESLRETSEIFKSRIFPEYIEDSIWLQLISPSSVTADQLGQLQDYENFLFAKHKELDSQKIRITEDLNLISEWKENLSAREQKVIGLEALKEQLEKEREELKAKYEELMQTASEMEIQISTAKSKSKSKVPCASNWGNLHEMEKYENIEPEGIEYLKMGLEELSQLQQKGIIEENLTEVLIENLIRFGENLIQREKDFQRIYKAKLTFLENHKTEVEEMKKMLQIQENLGEESKKIEEELEMKIVINNQINSLEMFKDLIFERQIHGIDQNIMEIEQEEMQIKKLEYENELSRYQKLNSELQLRTTDYDNKIFEMKTILQLLASAKPGNLETFKQEISRILIKNDSNPETSNKLKVIMTLYLWLTKSFNNSYGKHQLLAKISFYLLRIRAIMLKQGFSVAPVQFSTPVDFMWLEVFWLRSKHYYFSDFYVRPELVSITKHWFTKFIIRKMNYAFEVMDFSYKRMVRNSFNKLQNLCIEKDKKKTQCLYSQLMKVKEKSFDEIRKDINKRAACKVLPFFERFDKFWVFLKKIHLLKWRNFSERIENLYYQHTIYEIYSNLSELMHKEHKFKEECRANQSILRSKINENNKLLDKILF